MAQNKPEDKSSSHKSVPVAKDSLGKEKRPASSEAEKLKASEWVGQKKAVWRAFPGPADKEILLRVAMERGAYAEVIAHAKESLDAEICGALAGEVCEDDAGFYVHVQGCVRGSAARQGSTHVTFTQETWNRIHQAMEKDYPKLQVIGWYHSHPGFGVEFSEMDRFIQKNFFPAPTQIALVTDPLGGDVAICLNTPQGIRHLEHFWVEGREHRCKVPAAEAARPAGARSSSGPLEEELQAIQSRLSQLLQAFDEQQARFQRVLLTLFILIALGIVAFIGWHIFSNSNSKWEPPRNLSYVEIPVPMGDQVGLIGVQVVGVKLPPEMQAALLAQLEKLAKESKGATNSPNDAASGTATNTTTLPNAQKR